MPLPNHPPPSAWMASMMSCLRFSQISAALCSAWARLEKGSCDHSGKAAWAASMAAAVSERPPSGTSAQTEPSAGLRSWKVFAVAVQLPPIYMPPKVRAISALLVAFLTRGGRVILIFIGCRLECRHFKGSQPLAFLCRGKGGHQLALARHMFCMDRCRAGHDVGYGKPAGGIDLGRCRGGFRLGIDPKSGAVVPDLTVMAYLTHRFGSFAAGRFGHGEGARHRR